MIPIKRFRSNEVIFSEGDAATDIFVIISGSVEIYHTKDGEDKTIATLGEDDVFGDMAIISNAPRSASAKAVSNISCYAISVEQVKEQIEQANPMIQTIMKVLVKRLKDMNEIATK